MGRVIPGESMSMMSSICRPSRTLVRVRVRARGGVRVRARVGVRVRVRAKVGVRV